MAKYKRNTKGKTATEWMWKAVVEDEDCEERKGRFPFKFISAVRVALEQGMSADQITAGIVLFAGVFHATETIDGEELVVRSREFVLSMREDIDRLTKRELDEAKYRNLRELRKRKKKVGIMKKKVQSKENE